MRGVNQHLVRKQKLTQGSKSALSKTGAAFIVIWSHIRFKLHNELQKPLNASERKAP